MNPVLEIYFICSFENFLLEAPGVRLPTSKVGETSPTTQILIVNTGTLFFLLQSFYFIHIKSFTLKSRLRLVHIRSVFNQWTWCHAGCSQQEIVECLCCGVICDTVNSVQLQRLQHLTAGVVLSEQPGSTI